MNSTVSAVSAATVSPSTDRLEIKPQKRTQRARKASDLTHPQIQKRLHDMPPKYRNTYRRAKSGKDLRAAITSFCQECTQWQREEIAKCTAVACPLYGYRPYQEK